MKILQASFCEAIEGPGERRASTHFTDSDDPNVGFKLSWDEKLSAVRMLSNKTKQIYLVPFAQCKFVRIESETGGNVPRETITEPKATVGKASRSRV